MKPPSAQLPTRAGRDLPIRLALTALFVGILSYLSRSALIDDALIYARYIANALHGRGLVFNPGEHINALTSPLYSYLVLAAARLTGGHVLAASAVVSGVSLFAACALAETLVPFAGLLLASTGYFYSLVGMESALFLFMLLLTLVCLRRERESWLPTVGLLLVLTRFEGGAMLLPVAWELSRRRRWPSWRAYAPPAVLTLAYLALNHHWYGTFLPASASAKFGQGKSGYWGRWPFAFFDTAYQLKPEFLPTLYVVLGVVVLLIPGMLKLRRSVVLWVSLPFLGILLCFYLLFNIPGYKWYYAPFLCFAMLYACAALPAAGWWRWAAVPVILLSAWSAEQRFAPHKPRGSASQEVRPDGYPGIAKWLQANAAGHPRVEAAEIGMLGWYCPHCDVQDILGLTSPKNAGHIAHHDLRSWLAEDHPDYVVMHRGRWIFEDVARDDPSYAPVPVDFGPVVYLLQRRR